MTFNNFKKTKQTLRGQKKKILLSQPSESYDLQPQSTFMPVLIRDFFQLKEIVVHTMYCFSLCKNKAFHSKHCGRLSGGAFVIFADLEVCASISRFTENVYLSH